MMLIIAKINSHRNGHRPHLHHLSQIQTSAIAPKCWATAKEQVRRCLQARPFTKLPCYKSLTCFHVSFCLVIGSLATGPTSAASFYHSQRPQAVFCFKTVPLPIDSKKQWRKRLLGRNHCTQSQP